MVEKKKASGYLYNPAAVDYTDNFLLLGEDGFINAICSDGLYLAGRPKVVVCHANALRVFSLCSFLAKSIVSQD